MKTLIWMAFVVLALLWSGFWWLANGWTGSLLAVMASGQITDAAQAMASVTLPAWMALWIDPVWAQGLQALLVAALQWLEQVFPMATGLMDWITPMVWTAWTLGMLMLLASALAGHWLVNRGRP